MLAIIGLAGIEPLWLGAIAAIVLGVGFLGESVPATSRRARFYARNEGSEGAFAGGMGAEFIAGISGIVLGVLGLIFGGVLWGIMLSVALIVFGAALLLGSATARCCSIHLGKLKNLRGLGLDSAKLTPAGLEHLCELRNLEFLGVNWSQIGREGIVHLRPFVHLKRLTLSGIKPTDEDLADIGTLGELRQLIVYDGAKITDAGLAHLSELTALEVLELRGTLITDAGLIHLKRLRKLKALCLEGSQVTDEGVEHLEGLTGLEWLNLMGTKTTDKGRARLYHALPACEVIPIPAGLPARRTMPVG